jgi:hypothetical protein
MYYGKLHFATYLNSFSRSYTVEVVATVFATPTGLTEGTVVASTATNRLYGRNNSLATPQTGWMGATTVVTGATVATATNRLYRRNNSLATPGAPTGWMGATVQTGATVVVTNWLDRSNSRNGSNSP